MKCTVVKGWALVLSSTWIITLSATAQSSLVATGSVWKYLDTGVDPGTAWRVLPFDDGAWLSGPAQLGFGDSDETTRISQTDGSGNTNLAFYFRRVFTVAVPSAYTNLVLRLQRDDGAVVYLNGTEVFRSNMPLGPIDYGTPAATIATDDGNGIFATGVDPALLVAGDNLLAVEVHQATPQSSDISFDLDLLGNVPLSFIPLISSGAVWKYLDDGSDQGSAWVTRTFDDSGWSDGVAQLGFGDGDEATLIRRFSDLTGTNGITYYFRHAFNLTSVSGITNLVARIIRDDGAIVYLNGAEALHINLPAGPVTFDTLASQVIGNDNDFHAAHLNPALLVAGRNVVAVEMHQFNLTSSDISFDLELWPNVPPVPPAVVVTGPPNGSSFYGPTDLAITALATDWDSPISSVAFYVNDSLRGTDLTDSYELDGENYSLLLSNLAAGEYTLRAVATDAGGLKSTSAPVNISIALATTLIPTDAVWKYSDIGVNWSNAWTSLFFNDATWTTGAAKFGTNDPATTVIHIKYANGTIIPTCYFRHSFVVSNAASYTNLAFRVLRDDGCIAYLNGNEIFRLNMPGGLVTYNTYVPLLQAVGGADESTYYSTNTDTHFLLNGTNVLAVELHQTSSTSDAGFDLGLLGVAVPTSVRPPLGIQRARTNVIVSWPGSGFIVQEAGRWDGPYSDRPAATSPYTNPVTAGNKFFRLIKP